MRRGNARNAKNLKWAEFSGAFDPRTGQVAYRNRPDRAYNDTPQQMELMKNKGNEKREAKALRRIKQAGIKLVTEVDL